MTSAKDVDDGPGLGRRVQREMVGLLKVNANGRRQLGGR
jgi:hypothetical protein